MSPRAHAQRTDLNGPAKEPITTAPGQAFGLEAEQRRNEQGAPMLGSQGDIPSPAPPVAAPATPSAAPPVRPAVQPGSLPFLDPTNRPDEPIQTGLSTGPGPGPEILGRPKGQLSQALGQLAADPRAGAGVFEAAANARALGL